MKRIFAYILFCFIISDISGQNIELSCGLNRNNYFDSRNKDERYTSENTPGFGYSFGISISEIKIDTFCFRISARIDNYKCSLNTAGGGIGSGYRTKANVDKTFVGLSIYPINFTIFKKLKFSLGGEFGYKIYDRTTGIRYSFGMGGGRTLLIDNETVKINKNFIFGLSVNISYVISINDNWSIAPQYKFCLPLINEFINTEEDIISLRHNFEIGIIRRIK
ncbi:MAG: hypothetical protein ACOYO1_13490 [Bacteroidales bacterium]